MELSQLGIFLTVATEKSFSRAAQKLDRTQPAISLAVQRLESELGEKLLDRSLKDGTLTDAGKIVSEYALRIENIRREMANALTELRDKRTGKLTIGANETGALYLLTFIRSFRQLYPRVKVEVRRSLSRNVHVLLHTHHLPAAEPRREPPETGRFRAGHPSGAAHPGLHQQGAVPHHLGRRAIPRLHRGRAVSGHGVHPG